MVDADELAKLNELRVNGVLTEKEFNRQKKALLSGRKSPLKPWWVRVLLSMVLVWFTLVYLPSLFHKPSNATPAGTATTSPDANRLAVLPECNSSQVEEIIAKIIANQKSDVEKTTKLLHLGDVKQISFDAQKPERICTGKAYTSSVDDIITFRLYTPDDDNTTFFVEIQANPDDVEDKQ